ncbi:amidase [Sporosarcina sp. ACRSL]|uniref:amidase n=1 Tax=Sporosarcina sp. ACRSL TaxID=2918215 RepID=UPI001EF3D894|nr:amidase [Sporosarcina sp. ACRSL]MCG7345275.1 amidase [Sporosarcina sp. ACRSL]
MKNVSSVLDADAWTIREMIVNGEMTSSQITSLYIEQIKEKNPSVNFLVEECFATAMEEAEQADIAIAEGVARGVLFGVPISMKESFHVAGMKTTGGLIRRKNDIQDDDAEVVRKLKAEGAIIVGKTNTPELCFCQETDNKLHGRTNNPWNLHRTAGGSSGGEGAAIALGAVAVGLGSDIGGSIRFPSHFNGVIGFKSGNRQVSQVGSFPYVDNAWQERMLGIGPIAKSVRDAKLVYSIIADNPMEKKEVSDFIINVFRTTAFPLSDESVKLLNDVYLAVKNSYMTEREPLPLLDESALLWQEIMSIDGGESIREIAYGNAKGNPVISYINEKTKGTADIHRYLSWALIGTSLFKPSAKRIDEISDRLDEGDKQLDEYLEKRLIIMPVYHKAAPLHGVVYKEIFSIRKTFMKYMPFVAYANTWGLPALTVPIGKDKEGMPIGLQIIGKNGNEDAIFSLGSFLEKHFGGYSRAV